MTGVTWKHFPGRVSWNPVKSQACTTSSNKEVQMSHLVPGLQIWSWVCVRSFLFFTLNHSSFMQSNINLKIGSFEFECMFIPFTCFGWSWIYSLDGSKPCVFLECIGLKAFAFVSWNNLAEWNDRDLPKPKLALMHIFELTVTVLHSHKQPWIYILGSNGLPCALPARGDGALLEMDVEHTLHGFTWHFLL